MSDECVREKNEVYKLYCTSSLHTELVKEFEGASPTRSHFGYDNLITWLTSTWRRGPLGSDGT
jgi:hypothetical protein